MRPSIRRREAHDLEAARKMVSDAERQALERAEGLRLEAEAIHHEAEAFLGAATGSTGRAGSEGDGGEGSTDAAGMLWPSGEEGEEEDSGPVAPGEVLSRFVERMSRDVDRLMDAAGRAAAQLHLQAEEDLKKAREESARILAMATKEAEDLLGTAVDAIERDAELAHTAKEQAERDAGAASAALSSAAAEADQIRHQARREAEQLLEDARREVRALREELAAKAAELVAVMDEARATFAELAAAGERGSV